MRRYLEGLDNSFSHTLGGIEETAGNLVDLVKPWTSVEVVPIANEAAKTLLQTDYDANSNSEDAAVDVLVLIKGALREAGNTRWVIRRFVWSKRSIVSELSRTFIDSLEYPSFLPALILSRAILEHIANCEILRRDLSSILDMGGSEIKPEIQSLVDEGLLEPEFALLQSMNDAIDVRAFGSRKIWFEYAVHGIHGKKRSYKAPPEESVFSTDMTARDLMKSIDILDKKVKGTRNTYDFLCEFAHPNLAVNSSRINTGGILEPDNLINMGWPISEFKHTPNDFQLSSKLYRKPLADVFDVLRQNLEYFISLTVELTNHAKATMIITQEMMAKSISKDPLHFFADEYCPCLSKKSVIKCCGRGIKRKKFGKFLAQ